MDVTTASRFISSLTKALQAVIHGSLDFSKNIEVGGYLYVRVDNAERVDYVLSEKLQKSDVNSMTFLSNSFHALPQPGSEHSSSAQDKSSESVNVSSDSAARSSSSAKSGTASHSSFKSPQHSSGSSGNNTNSRRSDNFVHPHGFNNNEDMFPCSSPGYPQAQNAEDRMPADLKWPSASSKGSASDVSEMSRIKSRAQSLTDFQTAFRNPPTTFTTSPQQSSSSSFSQNGSSSRHSSSNQHQGQGHQPGHPNKSEILPEASEMEVVHIKTEDEDDVFNIPLQCQQGGSETSSDGLTSQEKSPWLAMRMQQPFYFPYPRLARSHSWDRRMNNTSVVSNSKFSLFPGESGADSMSLTCKVCGKIYRSRQGLLFHERAKHQNVFNVYCPVCGKGFQQTTHMYGHMATHTNVKNFQCEACGTKYAHKTSLQQHIRSGSCRPSPGGSTAGLDLTTSQILRDLSPFGAAPTPLRPSINNSQSHSPLEPDFGQGHTDVEMTCRPPGSSSNLSHADASSPECGTASFGAEDNHDRLGDYTSGHSMRIDGREMGHDLSSHAAQLSGKYDRQAGGANRMGEQQALDLNRTSGDRPEDVGADSKVDLLQALTDGQLPLSFPSGGGGATHLGWIDTHLTPITSQTNTIHHQQHQQQQPDSFSQNMLPSSHSAAAATASFYSVPCQPEGQMATSRWLKNSASGSTSSTQTNSFGRVSCQLCGHVSFSQVAHLRHMTIRHSQRGDFACGECGKVFQTKLYLNQHMKSHGERKFACEVCDQRFLYKHHVPRHQLAVHGAVTYNISAGGVRGGGGGGGHSAGQQQLPSADPLDDLPVVFESSS